MAKKKNLASSLTTKNLVIIGLILIIAGNSFSQILWNIKLHELLANLGALFLLVGTLQWFFDEHSRQSLVAQLSDNVRHYLDKRERFSELGISDCLIDSKGIVADKGDEDLFIHSDKFAIGIHYSDGTIVRFEKIIKERIAQGKETEITYVDPDGSASTYLSTCISHSVDINQKIRQLLSVINFRFSSSNLVKLIPHKRVLRYSFIYSEKCIWIIFITNSDGYCPQIPALRITPNSDLFAFFQKDIKELGIST